MEKYDSLNEGVTCYEVDQLILFINNTAKLAEKRDIIYATANNRKKMEDDFMIMFLTVPTAYCA